jgi:hypothetical protein
MAEKATGTTEYQNITNPKRRSLQVGRKKNDALHKIV